jgi:AbrB family looped-hinge helix DNA binding protein
MSVEVRKIGERGQVTIPKDIREKENIVGGDHIEFVNKDGEIRIRKKEDLNEKLKEAYTESAEHDEQAAENWKHVSKEANEEIQ